MAYAATRAKPFSCGRAEEGAIMSNRSETFGRLLKGAINSIAAYEGKTAPAIEDELGDQIGVAGSTIQRYKAGHLPTEPRVVQVLAEAAVRRGYLSRAWLLRFLQAARYPSPDALVAQFGDLFQSSGDQRSSGLPSGMLAFLFTDIEGSTTLWEQHGATMERALARHDQLLRQTLDAYGGQVFNTAGDAFHAVFTTVTDALDAALATQRALAAEAWGSIAPIRVRAAVHVGAAQERDGDYYGPPLNRVARLCAAGHGGQVLLSNAAQELTRDALPKGTELRDLGEHRLKDLARPERIFQVTAPDLAADFPALRTLESYTHNLPAQATALIGREAEVLAICDLVRHDNMRLLTLTGPGGTGKTRLALQAAADLLDDFRDGVYFVPLAPLRDPDIVPVAIAETLNVKEHGDRPLVEQLKVYLHKKHILLLLDNFEQVAPAGSLVADLLAAAPNLKVLVTSREVLHLYGEHEYGVPPLSLPDIKRLPPIERLRQYEAVRLFIERAQAVRSDFAVTTENAPAIAEICVRLDGLPLAIELAAARSKLFPPKALLARLDKRLSLLTSGPRDLPARQQTLRNAIAWSYDLLDAAEQAIFARLSVFVGGCTLKAAEAVLADDQAGNQGDLTASIPASVVIDGLTSLLDKSLLKQEERVDAEPRFVMLETIREYALEQLGASGEEPELLRRHTRFFMELAEAAEEHFDGPGQRAWMIYLEAEHDNLRAALAWAIEAASDMGLRLAGALGRFWDVQGHHREGRDWLLKVLAQTKDDDRVQVKGSHAKALNQAGYLAAFQYDVTQAHSLLDQSVALWRAVGDQRGLAYALCDWGAAAFFQWSPAANLQGTLRQARLHLEESISVFRQLAEKKGLIRALFWHGLIAYHQGDDEIVRASSEACIELAREIGAVSFIAAATANLGGIAFRQGDYAAAQSLWEEALQLARDVGDIPTVAVLGSELGSLNYLQGNYELAKRLFEEVLQISRQLGIQHEIAWVLELLGNVSLQQHECKQAAAHFQESLALWAELHETHDIARCLAALAHVAEAEGRMERAARLLGATAVVLEASGKNFDDTELTGVGRIPITTQSDYERHVAAVRAALSAEAFAAAWATGRTLSLEQAIAEALAISGASE
jgi:predicted ATPase/class 3 adenylate cyclase